MPTRIAVPLWNPTVLRAIHGANFTYFIIDMVGFRQLSFVKATFRK